MVIDGPVDGKFVRSLIPEHAAKVNNIEDYYLLRVGVLYIVMIIIYYE